MKQVQEGTGSTVVEILKDSVYKRVFIKAMEDIVAYYAYLAYFKGQHNADFVEVLVKIYDQMVSKISRLLPIATQSPLCKKYRQIVQSQFEDGKMPLTIKMLSDIEKPMNYFTQIQKFQRGLA